MQTTIIILAILIISILIGYLLRHHLNPKPLNFALKISIYVLLFFMGVNIGTNQKLLDNLPSLGFQALIITTCAITGSLLSALILYKIWKKTKK